jgi:hypothetical protein
MMKKGKSEDFSIAIENGLRMYGTYKILLLG